MRNLRYLLSALVLTTVFTAQSFAAQADRIASIDSGRTVALANSVHPRAEQQYDRGPVSPSFKLTYMTLVTAPSPAQQAALDRLTAAQQDPTSPLYHQWLTPAQYADRFGLSQSDMDRLTTWLKGQGFNVISVGGGRNTVIFSGTSAQVRQAFGTEIHHFNINGEEHFANATPLNIPAALSGVVTGIRGMHDFRMHTASHVQRGAGPKMRPQLYDNGGGTFAFPNFLAPADVATIYDTTPLLTASPTPIDGTGEKLAIVGRTDIFLEDINDFRSGFGLTPISASNCTLNTPTSTTAGVITACTDPRFKYVLLLAGGTDPLFPDSVGSGDIGEADLDIEWSGAVATNAQIVYINSPTTDVTDSLAYALNPPTGTPIPAPVVSMSFGNCELGQGGLFMETELQQGASEGVTVLNSTGDVGASACDFSPPGTTSTGFPPQPYSPAVGGYAVSYPASSPWVTGVGGTAITLVNDSYPSGTSPYWNNANGTNGSSAKSYIPEIAWDDNENIAQFCLSLSNNAFCSQGGTTAVSGWAPIVSAQTAQEDLWIGSGGGGASNCYNPVPSTQCKAGFPQPSWQSGLSVPNLPAFATTPRTRWVPDVSMLASPTFPGYIFCTPQAPDGTSTNPTPVYTSTCVNGISGSTGAVEGFTSIIGGTSASAPVFAGIVTLLNQKLAGPASPGLGSINAELYLLAKSRATNHAFNQTAGGDNTVYCSTGTPSNTFEPSVDCPNTGILGFSVANADTTTGYNLATGLGSVDASNLATAWAATRTSSSATLSANQSGTISSGTPVTFTATVTTSTTATGKVTFTDNGSTTLGTVAVSGTTAILPNVSSLPAGTNSVTAAYNGDGYNAPSAASSPVALTVLQPDFTLTLTPSSDTVVAGHTAPASGAYALKLHSINGYNQATTISCSGLTGATCNFNPTSPVTPNGTTDLSVNMTITTLANVATGPATLTVTATNGGTLSHSQTFALTVTATDQKFTLAPQNPTYTTSAGGTVQATVTVTPTNGFNTPVTYTCTADTAPQSICTAPSGAQPVSINPQFTITTTTPTGALHNPFERGSRIFYAAFLPGLLGILFTFGSRKRAARGMRMMGMILMLGASTLWLGACSGSNTQKNVGTPPGSYTVTVNATTGGANPVTATTTINFTVN